MNKRTFYFLRDSVTGKFYTGQNTYIDTFDKAAVYFQRKNADKKLNELLSAKHCGSWPWIEKQWTTYDDKHQGQYALVKESIKLVNERKHLPNWGIEIVETDIKIT
jgi:hypothetical protein